MPATAVHAFFAQDLYNKLDDIIRKKIQFQEKNLLMFAQCTDPLMFYNVMNLKRGKKIRNFQYAFHVSKTNEFFLNIITYIKKNNYYNNPEVLTFLYGFISHFCLDSKIHPYIYYKTGDFNKKIKESFKYNCLHHKIEIFFDNTLINNRTDSNYKKFNISKFCLNVKPFSKELNDTIEYVFSETFNIKNMDKIYYKSLKQMSLFLKLFRRDCFGIKKLGYKCIDLITPKNTFRFTYLSYNQPIEDINNYLNLNHRKWNYPVDKKITSTKSFYDIYNDSLNEALYIIKNINNYFYNNKKINIDKLFNNKSYVTGINCDSKLKQKYFEF